MVLNAVKFLVCLWPGLVLSWQMPAFDFFTSGSDSALTALAAGATAGAALAAGAAEAVAAGLAADEAAGAVCACAEIPAIANKAAIKVVFNMGSFQCMAILPPTYNARLSRWLTCLMPLPIRYKALGPRSKAFARCKTGRRSRASWRKGSPARRQAFAVSPPARSEIRCL